MHLPRNLSSYRKKGQTLIEFLIILPVLLIMISIFYSFYQDMLYREIGRADMWFLMRATTTDPFAQHLQASDCANIIQGDFPNNVSVSTSASWGQIPGSTLGIFNIIQPFDPSLLETVYMNISYNNPLNVYFNPGKFTIKGAMWTSYASKHPGDYQIISSVFMAAYQPIQNMVKLLLNLLNALLPFQDLMSALRSHQ